MPYHRAYYPDDAVVSEEQGKHFTENLNDEQRERVVALVGEIIGERVTADDIVTWLDYGKGREAAYTWVIDPIDGTKGFLAQRSYTIAVGLLKDRQPFAGVMGSPGYPESDGKIFFARDGKAYVQDLDATSPVRFACLKTVAAPTSLWWKVWKADMPTMRVWARFIPMLASISRL
ncbi:hypothetical protein HC928_25455 [bacterium]|nr:hypothetical protein [bacterium]